MPHDERDHLQAVENQLLERRRSLQAEVGKLQAEMRKLEESAKLLREVRGELPAMLSRDLPPAPPDEDANSDGKRVDISGYIDRYFAETSAPDATAADVKKFMITNGVESYPSLYNSIHEGLRRRVARGDMVKDGARFAPKKVA